MSAVTYYDQWDKTGEKLFQLGVDRGMIYELTDNGYANGEAFSGLTNFNVTTEGGDANDQWADGIKYATIRGNEDTKFTLECLHYPPLMSKMNGEIGVANATGAAAAFKMAGQGRPTFGFSCRTKIGDDKYGVDSGYVIHLLYGCSCNPSDADYQTVNDSPEAITFSFECSTIPVSVTISGTAYKPVAHVRIEVTHAMISDSTVYAKIQTLEQTLYGTIDTSGTTPTIEKGSLPLPAAVYAALSAT